MERSLVIAALQTGLYPKDERRAIREGVSLTRTAAVSARLICFPEHWLTEKILKPDDEVYGIFFDLARELDIYINLGGVYDRAQSGKSETFFVSPTISSRGKLISKQKKVHLFRRENKIAIGGDSFKPFEIDQIKVGVMVCHDVVFPESARTLVLKGSELLLNPSLITARGIEPWRIYMMARVLENRVPIIAPNPYLGRIVPGDSVIMGLKYEKTQGIMEIQELARASKGRRIIESKIVFDNDIAAQRQERLNERKPNAYFNR
ncbi:MAG: carbon-nitrogen hydrolase family protein [Thaumarchaeota archaeon]|nr:carbon-nitrogen hydrolase family protein [Nitrososphaerota archaeon]